MNYTIKGITPVTMETAEASQLLDERFSTTENPNTTDFLGDIYRTDIEVVDDEGTPLYLSFLCGARGGILLEQCNSNYEAIESAPDILASDIKGSIALDFPRLLDRNFSEDVAKRAKAYLDNDPSLTTPVERKGHTLALIYSTDIVIHLTQRDVEYYASLNS